MVKVREITIKGEESIDSSPFSILGNLTDAEKNWIKIQYKVYEKKIERCFELFRENGIEPVLIKGWAVSHFYPESWQRFFTDIDICVDPKQYELAKKVFKSDVGRTLSIDLHEGLRRLDTLEWEELYAQSQTILIEDVEIRVLCPEDHLRVLCVHWLWDGGGYKEKLWDIYFLVKNRPVDFDWDRCLNSAGKKRYKWIVYAIGIAHKYLGLNLEGTPIEKEAKNLPKWLIKALEKEWKSEVRLQALNLWSINRKETRQQILKRFPPNPIQATIELEGDFDRGFRVTYQIMNIFQRLFNSTRNKIKEKFHKENK